MKTRRTAKENQYELKTENKIFRNPERYFVNLFTNQSDGQNFVRVVWRI